jgi:hypothetical protein
MWPCRDSNPGQMIQKANVITITPWLLNGSNANFQQFKQTT